MTVVEGTDIDIMCKVSGFPVPTHIWYKVGYTPAELKELAREWFLLRIVYLDWFNTKSGANPTAYKFTTIAL
jgi:hypothetical protein